jgi:hypothetical protein
VCRSHLRQAGSTGCSAGEDVSPDGTHIASTISVREGPSKSGLVVGHYKRGGGEFGDGEASRSWCGVCWTPIGWPQRSPTGGSTPAHILFNGWLQPA